VLEGATLQEVLKWTQTGGFIESDHTYDDGPFYSPDWTNPGVLKSALSQDR